ncbi:dihydroxyacetone kinase subunit DhaL [Actinomadura syzygii]|uniref:Dihydroxyacetone kinase subunit L n=1 Tax=Actinomadura syzygii TaxID=1427538 RepID=A0A5D0TUY8_9ACTN|nr:dihydroxyacetone kinase subunit DhaL [Actinomadura syzygii]TYC08669.1 dihydroxyacetone kinase subunit L [Actinomadura syzygii]
MTADNPSQKPAERTLLTGADARAWLLAYADRVLRDADELTDLDRRAGDGDFGWNVATALGKARTALLDLDRTAGPPDVFATVSDAHLGAGGTSGPLFGLWFGRLAKGPREPWTGRELARAFRDAVDAVSRLGGADVGQKTMVDAMVPAVEALEAEQPEPEWRAAVARAARAAAEGAESTRSMLARRGRASYVGEHARGVVDPGALAVAWFFESAANVERTAA